MKKNIFLVIFFLIAAIIFAWAFWYFKTTQPVSLISGVESIVSSKTTDEELKKEIGQMIMAGFRGTEAKENSEIFETINNVQPGGVVLFDFDVPSNSFPRNIENPKQLKSLIAGMQSFSKIPMFVSVDAEGGSVNRLKPKYGFEKIDSAEKMGADKSLKTVKENSEKLAKELDDAGINMNLAPVLDLNINSKNPAIGALGRSFSKNPEDVVQNAEIFITNHLKNNIITVEKHFPGQGSATEDSHLKTVDITGTYSQDELIPYKDLNEKGLLDAVMVAHVVNKNVDENYPATMSEKFLQEILRSEVGFDGVIFSDDMQMAAIGSNYGLEEAVVKAVNAGVDVISVLNNVPGGYDKDIALKTRDIIFKAVKEGKISEKRIKESYARIIALKQKFGIVRKTAEEIKSENFRLLASKNKMNFGEVLEIAKKVEQSTKVRSALIMAILKEELKLEEDDLCFVTDFVTGEGTRIVDNQKMPKTMHPERDMKSFLELTSALGKSPSATLVTCPMNFGWGGAMGPADFIPSTWAKYRPKVEEIVKETSNPWDIEHAIWAMGFYLADSGANSRTEKKEWDAAMIYFSSSPASGYNFYGDEVMEIAEEIQKDIDIIDGA